MVVFFFKQKTAYELRISDWSSDVCSSDLATPGTPDPRNAVAVIAALEGAAAACIAGTFDGLVTGPVHKASINAGGIAYTGTTGLLARQAGCEVVMMLANDIVRVALATTHLPLREVADAITPAALETTLRILDAALRDDFGRSEERRVGKECVSTCRCRWSPNT